MVKILSPANNFEIPINSQFEFTLGINNDRIRIQTVEISFNGLTQTLEAPYSVLLSTNRMRVGPRTISILVTDEQGNKLEKKQSVNLTREKLTYTKVPTIAGIKKNNYGATIEVMYSKRLETPEYIEFTVKNSKNKIIRKTRMKSPTSFTSFFLPKTNGDLLIEITTKMPGKAAEITSQRSYKFQ